MNHQPDLCTPWRTAAVLSLHCSYCPALGITPLLPPPPPPPVFLRVPSGASSRWVSTGGDGRRSFAAEVCVYMNLLKVAVVSHVFAFPHLVSRLESPVGLVMACRPVVGGWEQGAN